MERLNYNQKSMNEKDPQRIGPAGRSLIFGGVPVAVLAVLLVSTLRHGLEPGLANAVGEKALPYVLIFTPLVIVFGGSMLHKYFPKQLVIPFEIIGWLVGLALMYWYFWFGPGAFGHQK
jgi:hypothetical protein